MTEKFDVKPDDLNPIAELSHNLEKLGIKVNLEGKEGKVVITIDSWEAEAGKELANHSSICRNTPEDEKDALINHNKSDSSGTHSPQTKALHDGVKKDELDSNIPTSLNENKTEGTHSPKHLGYYNHDSIIYSSDCKKPKELTTPNYPKMIEAKKPTKCADCGHKIGNHSISCGSTKIPKTRLYCQIKNCKCPKFKEEK